MNLSDIETPALVLDRSRLLRNCQRMTQSVTGRGLPLRPHMKTAKCIDVARVALEGNFGGITVATLNEAEYFAAHGVRDILYAVGMVPAKLGRVARLIEQGVEILLVCDDADMAALLDRQARDLGIIIDVLIEIDSGEGRGGVSPEGEALLKVGGVLHNGVATRLAGVMGHAGHSYACRSLSGVVEVAEQERLAAVVAADRLRQAGLPCKTVSVGSTPTALHGVSSAGLTEVRAGVYMFGDAFQAGIGSCSYDDLAVSVLASVIGHRRDHDSLLIDAGALALSKDRSTQNGPRDVGFGLIRGVDGGLSHDLSVEKVYQEHGKVQPLDGAAMPFDILPLGARLRVLPNHVCMTAAMYDRYYVVDGTDDVVAVWHRTNGWESGWPDSVRREGSA